jgi:predicted nucleotidyltransferase
MKKNLYKASFTDEFLAALESLLSWLDAEEIPHVTIGGVAVALLVRARATQDIDAVLCMDTNQLESFLVSGGAFGFKPRISNAIEFARTRRVLLLQHQPSGVPVDLSFGVLPFESEMLDRAITLTIGSLKIKVPTPEDLIVMKALARRPRDIADIEAIINADPNLDFERIRYWVREFAATLEMPEIFDDLEKLLPH